MEELSLHILDLVENALMAGADLVSIEIDEQPGEDRMSITISDNGQGMEPELAARAVDPFVTTRTTRRIGLGLSLWQANVRAWDGDMSLTSQPGQGTMVKAWFRLGHIDRQPLGSWPRTLAALIMTRSEADFVYRHRVGVDEFELDTRELKAELSPEALTTMPVISYLTSQISKALQSLGSTA